MENGQTADLDQQKWNVSAYIMFFYKLGYGNKWYHILVAAMDLEFLG